jgi:2-methylcitrate dehydratase PrpD
MNSAMGIAMMQASGTMQLLLSGDPAVKGIYAAFPNLQGVLAVLLAQQGLDASFDALEGDFGLFKLYFGKYVRAPLVEGLGETFYVRQSTFKLSPVSGPNPWMQAAWKLKAEQKLDPNTISKVHLKARAQRRPWLEPVADRQEPHNSAAAADSVFFGLAKALVNPTFSLDDVSESGLKQREALRMAKLMSWSPLEDPNQPEMMEITTVDGHVYQSPIGPGKFLRPQPQTPPELIEKFLDCARYSVRPLSKKALEGVIQTIEELEQVDDVSILTRMVSNSV